MPKLKVYVTPIGFHDAYVAASSQKAALKSWGADANLFARGAASVVTDEKLAEEALANPGKVIKRLRGTAAEQIAAAEKTPSRPKVRADTSASPSVGARPAAKASPAKAKTKKSAARPSRKALEIAEAKLAAADAHYRDEQREIVARIAQLQQEREDLRAAETREIARLERQRDDARAHYQAAVEKWTSTV